MKWLIDIDMNTDNALLPEGGKALAQSLHSLTAITSLKLQGTLIIPQSIPPSH